MKQIRNNTVRSAIKQGLIETRFRSDRVWSSIKQGLIVATFFGMGISDGQQVIIDPNGTESSDPMGPQLVDVLPETERIPANFLKFYLIFPEPMERGSAFEHITLTELQKGGPSKEVLEPFREVELWDETEKRMTLWLHPGRQKPGVNLNVEFGPILTEGKNYRLEISSRWKTKQGKSLKEPSVHWYESSAPDYSLPKPQRWTVVGLRHQIQVTPLWSWNPRILDSLDPFSLQKRVTVKFPDGSLVTPLFDIGWQNFSLTLPDDEDFPVGKYQLIVDPKVEDLAGNSAARPFNLDLEKYPDFRERTEPYRIDFEIQ